MLLCEVASIAPSTRGDSDQCVGSEAIPVVQGMAGCARACCMREMEKMIPDNHWEELSSP